MALSLMAGGAVAADMPVKAMKAPAPVAVWNWTGFYVGANGGYGWDNEGVGYTFDNFFFGLAAGLGNVPTSQSLSSSGALAGGQVGYNYQVGAGVIGVEADFDWADIKGTARFFDIPTGVQFLTTADRKINSIGTARARAGFLPSNQLLLYVTGGFAWGDTRLTITQTPLFGCGNIPGCLTATSSGWSTGWTVGAGAEWMFAQNWSFKAEYLYVDLGSRSATVTSVFGGPGNFYTGTTSFREHTVRAGINYHFGGPVVAKY
jgi:outer membrane immunogenic protein